MSVHPLNRPSALPAEARQALDRMDAIGDGWAAISDLMIPETDLHVVDRERLQRLLDLLAREYQKARERFTAALNPR